ncbi:phage repressor protein CI (plasmid) [Vibrio cholerae]|uniref:phage repressor protein CI n=2 Tax=Vibrio cholerae TaxID=666 RepID=UPI001183AE11|nr:phage repressor protein CI [Vibrio cholerae]EJL6460742.1 phage repressor protein CI [Vibrio cholerae]MBJ6953183.1 phage repressor protein CI [Vibrio cholerae]MVC22320.1 hypothetical protein [Vibrio cholerae]QKU73375.1 phage repressor protein CI [Vibrio cholerae]QKU77367.1 phage repressor protein CI [Vibrio cholerae]
MKADKPTVPMPDYGDAKAFINRLKIATGEKKDGELAILIGKPKSTIATWKQQNRINHEAMILVHLLTGASIQYLALGIGDPFPNGKQAANLPVSNEQPESNVVHMIQNGELFVCRTMTLGKGTLDFFGLNSEHLTIVDHEDETLFIDRQESLPSSGRYLVAIDNVFGVYELQRLPNSKVEVQFSTSNHDLNLADLLIAGKVKMAMKKR